MRPPKNELSLAQPGAYKVQFVDCNDTPVYAGQWWNGAARATAQTVQLTAGQVVHGIDASLSAGAVGTVSGHVVDASGAAMTDVCVIAFLPNQFARAAQVGSDGSYRIDNVPSGTYALAFLGCNSNGNGDPSPTITLPGTSITYQGVWWTGAPVNLQNGGDGGPDPIAQGATLVDVAPGQAATGYDHCFGCGAIVITGITGGHGSLTVSFTTPGFSAPSSTPGTNGAQAVPVTYTVTCTSTTGGVSGSATGAGSPITVSGLTPGASYTCTVTASDGSTTAGSSSASSVVVASAAGTVTPTTPGTTPTNAAASGDPASSTPVAGTLPRTGSGDAGALTRAALTLLAIGLGLSIVATRRRSRRLPLA